MKYLITTLEKIRDARESRSEVTNLEFVCSVFLLISERDVKCADLCLINCFSVLVVRGPSRTVLSVVDGCMSDPVPSGNWRRSSSFRLRENILVAFYFVL